MGIFNLFKRKKMKPREIREKYGTLATTNVTPLQLQQGVERQWRRYNCRVFQEKEFYEQLNRVFPNSKEKYKRTAVCDCDYCSRKQESVLKSI